MLREAGTALLNRAQAEGEARDLFEIIAGSILTDPFNASTPPRENASLYKETEQ